MGNKMSRCVIIAASPDVDTKFISDTVKSDDFVICADAGYNVAQAAGITPDIIIGDFDSAKKPNPAENIITLPVEKDFTDTMSAVEIGIEKGYKNFLLLNVTGGRIDHTLNNLYTLDYICKLGGNGVIEDRSSVISLLTEGNHILNGLSGLTISLFPFACKNVRLTYVGMKYPLQDYLLKPDMPIAVSNIVLSDNASITVADGKALLVVNKLKQI